MGAAQHDEPDDLEWVEFDPENAPSVLTSSNLCALFGGCERCPGWTTVAATALAPDHPNQDELVFCKHECHRMNEPQHHSAIE
jgi:hypothetical protein